MGKDFESENKQTHICIVCETENRKERRREKGNEKNSDQIFFFVSL